MKQRIINRKLQKTGKKRSC